MKGHWTAYMVISFMTCISMHRIELLPVKDCGGISCCAKKCADTGVLG